MAPEQARNSHLVDIRADLYSLGCTFYQLLTGEAPFAGGTFTEKLLKHQLHEPVRVELRRPAVPARVAAIIHKLLAKSPDDRYQVPRELATALASLQLPRAAAACEGSTVFPSRAITRDGNSSTCWAQVTAAALPGSVSRSKRARHRAAARRRMLALGVAGTLLAVGVFVFTLLLRAAP
jgi:serine/threonine protein kinase